MICSITLSLIAYLSATDHGFISIIIVRPEAGDSPVLTILLLFLI
jgi:hypothetical protein